MHQRHPPQPNPIPINLLVHTFWKKRPKSPAYAARRGAARRTARRKTKTKTQTQTQTRSHLLAALSDAAYNTVQSFHSDSAVSFSVFLNALPDMCAPQPPDVLMRAMQVRGDGGEGACVSLCLCACVWQGVEQGVEGVGYMSGRMRHVAPLERAPTPSPPAPTPNPNTKQQRTRSRRSCARSASAASPTRRC